jgi:hypothetical protein
VDVGLVGLVLFGGEAAEAREHLRRDPDGDQLFSVSSRWAPDTASTAELSICRFGDIRIGSTRTCSTIPKLRRGHNRSVAGSSSIPAAVARGETGQFTGDNGLVCLRGLGGLQRAPRGGCVFVEIDCKHGRSGIFS